MTAKFYSISEIMRLRHEGIVEGVRGTVKIMWPSKGGTTKGRDARPWSIQNFILQDGRDEIKVVLKDRDELDEREWKGREIVIEAKHGSRGWTGIQAKDDDYKPEKIERILWVTPTAIITAGNDGGHQRNDPPRDDRRDTRQNDRREEYLPPAEPPRNERQPENPDKTARSGKLGPKSLMGRIAAVYLVADSAARVVAQHLEKRDGKPVDAEQLHNIRQTLVIQAFYEKVYFDSEPIKAVEAAKQEKQPEPPKQDQRREPPPPPPEEPPVEDGSDVPF